MTDTYERKIDLKLLLSIIATGIMSFSGIVVETAMNVTFPALMHEFDVNTNAVQWITTGYLLILALIIPTSSYLKKNYSNKTLFITAIIMFIIGTVLAAFTPYFSLLLISRILQGIGTGIALPLMFNIILEQVPGKQLGFIIGIASLITAMAPAIGPSVGGLLVSLYGWRMIFIALLPFLLFSFGAGIYSVRQVTPVISTKFYLKDYLFMAISFISFIFATTLPAKYGWLSIPVCFLLLLSIASIGLFCSLSLKKAEPLLQVQVFSVPAFTCSLISILLLQFICLALGFLLPNYAQLTRGEQAFYAGIILLPGCTLGALLAPISGKMLDRFGAIPPVSIGNILSIISCILFAFFYEQASYIELICFYILFAAGQSSAVGNLLTYSLKQLSEEVKSDGNAIINTLQQLAGAAGTAVITSIVASAQFSSDEGLAVSTAAGTGTSLQLLALLSVFMLSFSLLAFRFSKK